MILAGARFRFGRLLSGRGLQLTHRASRRGHLRECVAPSPRCHHRVGPKRCAATRTRFSVGAALVARTDTPRLVAKTDTARSGRAKELSVKRLIRNVFAIASPLLGAAFMATPAAADADPPDPGGQPPDWGTCLGDRRADPRCRPNPANPGGQPPWWDGAPDAGASVDWYCGGYDFLLCGRNPANSDWPWWGVGLTRSDGQGR
jgi:hypothetical protein